MSDVKISSSVEALYAIIFAACVLAALVLLTSCSHGEAPADAGPSVRGESVVFSKEAASSVSRIAVEKVEAAMERDLVLPARITWDEERTVRVFAPFAGRVARMIARPGDRVSVGSPLAELMSPDFGQAQADARKAQAALSLATLALERQKELNAHGVTAAKDLQQAQADEQSARAEADRAVGRLSAYGHVVAGDNVFVLKSPTAGVVVERHLNPGQELRPDQPGDPLFVITDPTHLWVSIDAGEADLANLKPGMPLVITSNQFPDDAFDGTLSQISDFIDPNTRTLKLRGEVPNPNRQLKGEMYVQARIRAPKGAYPTVNAKAVYLSGTKSYVFVRDGANTFTRRQVKTGRTIDGRTPVLDGLRQGEDVVVAGNLMLDQILANAPPQGEKTAKQ